MPKQATDGAEGKSEQANHSVNGHDDNDREKGEQGVEQGDTLLTA